KSRQETTRRRAVEVFKTALILLQPLKSFGKARRSSVEQGKGVGQLNAVAKLSATVKNVKLARTG
ncbi:MAG: hypothetical protein IKK39_12095, partial [Thermoguttaceae bacterium]|nr:hypothetical protein [Thermoguttaceae bacterium]